MRDYILKFMFNMKIFVAFIIFINYITKLKK